MEEKLSAAKLREKSLRAEIQGEAAYSRRLEHKIRAEKGAKTKLKKRIAKGACPCCNRHFVNLQRHIEGQHPEYPASK